MTKNPFKFLDSYTIADKDIFFGRETEIEEIYSRLFHSKLLLIYGPSGSGKTSLLQCGVSDRFGEHNWKPVFIRRKQNIIGSIQAEIEKQALIQLKKDKSLTEKLYSLYLDFLTPVYLIFDQLEELFIFGDVDEKKEFVAVLKDILSHGEINTQVILSIREEYLASLSEFEDELPQLFENRIRIEKMKKAQALSVIVFPCEVCHVGLEKGLPETAIEKIINESATIELTWLQVLMDRLYKSALTRNEETIEIKLSDLEALGQIGDVLGNFLEEQLNQMPEGAKAEAVLKTLISSEGTKRQLTLSEIKDHLELLGYRIDTGDIKQFVQHFITVRILNDKDDNDRYELRHDSLAAKIFERLTLAERELQEVRQFVENAYKSYLKTEHLLGRKELSYVCKYENKLFLKGDTAAFINASKKIILERDKIQSRIKAFSILSFLLMCFFVGRWAFYEVLDDIWFKAAAKTIFYKDDEPKLSLTTAIDSYRNSQHRLASRVMFESFYNLWNEGSQTDSLGNEESPYNKVIDFKPCKSKILYADYSSDGTYIYGYLADTSIMIWSQFGKELFHYRISDKPVLQLKMSNDNNYLSCLQSDSIAYLCSIEGVEILRTKISFDLINPKRVMAFSPDSKLVAYSTDSNKIKIFYTEGSDFQEIREHTQPVTAIDFSNNGQFLASASKDNTIVIYYLNHEKKLYEVYSIIKDHRDIVWSVEFANNNKYIISASEDSTIRIWDYKGKDVLKPVFQGLHISMTTFDSLFNSFKSKYSDAFFSPLEDYIIFKYKGISDPDTIKSICISWNALTLNESFKGCYFTAQQVRFSSSTVIYKTLAGETRLISSNSKKSKYYTFKEHFTSFSANNDYMFGIDDNMLRFYPVNETEIIRLTRRIKIFGKL